MILLFIWNRGTVGPMVVRGTVYLADVVNVALRMVSSI